MRRKRKNSQWDKQFGRRLKVAREARRITQQKMADILDVKLDTYQKYESGARSFPKDLLADVVRNTDYGLWFLITGEPDDLDPVRLGTETLTINNNKGKLKT